MFADVERCGKQIKKRCIGHCKTNLLALMLHTSNNLEKISFFYD